MINKRFLTETFTVFLMVLLILVSVGDTAAQTDIAAVAKRDAERDAKRVSKLKWFASGFFGSALPCLSLFALLYGDAHGVYIEDDIPRVFGPDTLYMCCTAGIGAGMLLPTGYAIFHSPTLPAEAFLGKSPDYIAAYTSVDTLVDRRQARAQRAAFSAMGCLTGISVGTLILSTCLPESYETEDKPF
ncbi:MAG: hypothetical protein OXH00_23465 [Candidatus Poribacteria bacterium]|nr:hypothetical protein [Candidatus Poribacteria bacterium]